MDDTSSALRRLTLLKPALADIASSLASTMRDEVIPILERGNMDAFPSVSMVFRFKDGSPDLRVELSIAEDTKDEDDSSG